MTSAGQDEEEWRKRLAVTGQWKTPPTPMYAADTSSSAVPSVGSSIVHADALSQTRTAMGPSQGSHAAILPSSNAVDYTAALQEAYLRGAQAAAALAARSGSTGSINASTEATQHSTVLPLPAVPNPLLGLSTSDAMGMPPPPQQSHVREGEQPVPNSSRSVAADPIATVITSSTAPFPFVTPISSPSCLPAALPVLPSGANTLYQTTVPQQAPQHRSPANSGPIGRTQEASLSTFQPGSQRPVLTYPPRAMSMPNMGFDLEDEKRQKRLARNRASARLRRMRKKNLVEAYEVEVGILEKTLESLKKHQWGLQDDAGPLIEALSLDRGQQHLTIEERQMAAKDILDQQLQFVGLLEDCMREQFVLFQLTQESGELSDLKDALLLSPEQCTRIADSASGWEEDWYALQTVKSSLEAMRNSSWLLSDNANTVVDGFLSILHKTQVSKLLLWCDHNIDSIDDLDYVNASFDPNPSSGPLFHFGISNNPDCLLDSSSGKID